MLILSFFLFQYLIWSVKLFAPADWHTIRSLYLSFIQSFRFSRHKIRTYLLSHKWGWKKVFMVTYFFWLYSFCYLSFILNFKYRLTDKKLCWCTYFWFLEVSEFYPMSMKMNEVIDECLAWICFMMVFVSSYVFVSSPLFRLSFPESPQIFYKGFWFLRKDCLHDCILVFHH